MDWIFFSFFGERAYSVLLRFKFVFHCIIVVVIKPIFSDQVITMDTSGLIIGKDWDVFFNQFYYLSLHYMDAIGMQ